MASSRKTFEDLDLTNDEVKRIGEALKDENFRKLFVEYAEEISNPENRKRYEEEIAQMENERGMDVEFVHPQPGHVLKTSGDGDKKLFINICTNDKIGKPTSQKQTRPDGRKGLQWQIPHSFAQPREDFIKGGKHCQIFDVVFHPDTYRMADNPRFAKLVEDTALDGIEKQFDVKLDRKNMKRLKNKKYQGMPAATVIRRRKGDVAGKQSGADQPDVLKNMPYPYDNLTSEEKANLKNKEIEKRENDRAKQTQKMKTKVEKKEEDGFTLPKYEIIHRSELDIQEYRNSPDARPNTRPKEIVIKIELPLLTSAAQANLDVFEERLLLESHKPAAYKLDLKLPYPVDDGQGSAKFDKGKRCLSVTLPVIPAKTPTLPQYNGENLMENGNSLENGEAVVNGNVIEHPLIQEIPSLEDIGAGDELRHADDLPDLEDITDEIPLSQAMEKSDTHYDENIIAPTLPKIHYMLPEYDFHQDSETVSFTFYVHSVSEDTVSKTFPKLNLFNIKFASVGSGGFPMHYSAYIQFPDGCDVASDHCSIDVSDKNVVLLLLKGKACRSAWEKFQIGVDETELQEKLFITESNLEKQLKELEAEAEAMGQTLEQTDMKPQVNVTEMNHKRLTIKIKKPSPPSSGNESEDDQDADDENTPSSADIKVVHERQPPNLHGILKQHSVSESSEDSPLESGSPTSPREGGLRKSVSFNSHVDRTTYKTNQAVTTMKQAVRSQRRRNRKRQEKSRRRHNSGSSDYSSGDDHDAKVSDSVGDEGGNGDACFPIGEMDGLEDGEEDETTDDVVVAEAESKMEDGATKEESQFVKDVKSKLSEKRPETNADDSDDDFDDAYRTKSVAENEGGKNDEERKAEKEVNRTSSENMKQSETDALTQSNADLNAGDNHKTAADDVQSGSNEESAITSEAAVDVGVSVGGKNVIADGMDLNGNTEGGVCENLRAEDRKVSLGKKVKQAEPGVCEQSVSVNGVDQNRNAGKGVCANKEGEKTESKNGCEDKVEQLDSSAIEHRTTCAFEFSNSVMFDLDVD